MTFDLEYNSERPLMIIPEYGRHIQKLVDHCLALETSIVDVMGNLQPHLRDVPDFKHKLWDQLYIMADFKLDVESPYPQLSKAELQEKPERLAYPKSASRYRYYGNNIQTMIDIALSWEDSDKKDALVFTIANHMKKCYLNWNKDTVDDEIIFKHLYDLSDGKLDLRETEEALSESKNLLRKRNSQGQNNAKTATYKKPQHSNQNQNKNRKR
jgi:hypothetical protein